MLQNIADMRYTHTAYVLFRIDPNENPHKQHTMTGKKLSMTSKYLHTDQGVQYTFNN